jgi:hypothetical protein
MEFGASFWYRVISSPSLVDSHPLPSSEASSNSMTDSQMLPLATQPQLASSNSLQLQASTHDA